MILQNSPGIKDVIKALWCSRMYRTERALTILSTLASLALFLDVVYEFSCQLSILQNVIVPFLVTLLVLTKIGSTSFGQRLKLGIGVGALTGAIPALLVITVSNIKYYFLGGLEMGAGILERRDPQITPYLLYVGIGSTLVIWILLVVISALSGLVAGTFSRIQQLRTK